MKWWREYCDGDLEDLYIWTFPRLSLLLSLSGLFHCHAGVDSKFVACIPTYTCIIQYIYYNKSYISESIRMAVIFIGEKDLGAFLPVLYINIFRVRPFSSAHYYFLPCLWKRKFLIVVLYVVSNGVDIIRHWFEYQYCYTILYLVSSLLLFHICIVFFLFISLLSRLTFLKDARFQRFWMPLG